MRILKPEERDLLEGRYDGPDYVLATPQQVLAAERLVAAGRAEYRWIRAPEPGDPNRELRVLRRTSWGDYALRVDDIVRQLEVP